VSSVRKEPKTKLTASISFTSGNYFSFPGLKGKFKIDGYFPIEKANHLLKDEDDVERLSLLSFASMKNKFNTTISMVGIIYVTV